MGANRRVDPKRSDEYVLGPGDVIQIVVWRNEHLSKTLPVRPDGKISLPLVDDLQASGVTPSQLKEMIAKGLKQFIDNPIVTVIVSEVNNYKVSVLGEVKKPGVYLLKGRTTLLEAISMAEGFTEFATTNNILLMKTANRPAVSFRLPCLRQRRKPRPKRLSRSRRYHHREMSSPITSGNEPLFAPAGEGYGGIRGRLIFLPRAAVVLFFRLFFLPLFLLQADPVAAQLSLESDPIPPFGSRAAAASVHPFARSHLRIRRQYPPPGCEPDLRSYHAGAAGVQSSGGAGAGAMGDRSEGGVRFLPRPSRFVDLRSRPDHRHPLDPPALGRLDL
ncbi:MAG: polysaccharide biosynthesis/export family protein [Candidatus Manganitrophus sp.]|nr:polysaccharide biosynthesis/export family protein [Candidatus Manganitrophus sp.]